MMKLLCTRERAQRVGPSVGDRADGGTTDYTPRIVVSNSF